MTTTIKVLCDGCGKVYPVNATYKYGMTFLTQAETKIGPTCGHVYANKAAKEQTAHKEG